MNTLKNGIALFALALLASACDTKTNEKTEAAADSVTLHEPAPTDLNSDQSALLKTILGPAEQNPAGVVLRGIAFGDAIAKVKATETFEMFEETPDHLGYTSETAQLETIGELSGVGTDRIQRMVDEENVVDAQIGYEFQSGPMEGLSILAQVNNLTDEQFKTFENDDRRRVIDYQQYGRTFLVGLNYRY